MADGESEAKGRSLVASGTTFGGRWKGPLTHLWIASTNERASAACGSSRDKGGSSADEPLRPEAYNQWALQGCWREGREVPLPCCQPGLDSVGWGQCGRLWGPRYGGCPHSRQGVCDLGPRELAVLLCEVGRIGLSERGDSGGRMGGERGSQKIERAMGAAEVADAFWRWSFGNEIKGGDAYWKQGELKGGGERGFPGGG